MAENIGFSIEELDEEMDMATDMAAFINSRLPANLKQSAAIKKILKNCKGDFKNVLKKLQTKYARKISKIFEDFDMNDASKIFDILSGIEEVERWLELAAGSDIENQKVGYAALLALTAALGGTLVNEWNKDEPEYFSRQMIKAIKDEIKKINRDSEIANAEEDNSEVNTVKETMLKSAKKYLQSYMKLIDKLEFTYDERMNEASDSRVEYQTIANRFSNTLNDFLVSSE